MPSLYQFVSCSRSHVRTTRITLSPSLKPLSHAVYPSVAQKDENLTAHNFHTQHTTVCECFPHFLSLPLRIQLQFVVCNVCHTHRRHFHRLLQRCYLSDDRVLTHMSAINISVAASQFSHCYLYSGIRKKMWDITF